MPICGGLVEVGRANYMVIVFGTHSLRELGAITSFYTHEIILVLNLTASQDQPF